MVSLKSDRRAGLTVSDDHFEIRPENRQRRARLAAHVNAVSYTHLDVYKRQNNKCDRLVMVWCGSTEIFLKAQDVHKDLKSFEKAMRTNDPAIAPSMLYAYAAISEGVPFANGARCV